jgi:TonB family protein
MMVISTESGRPIAGFRVYMCAGRTDRMLYLRLSLYGFVLTAAFTIPGLLFAEKTPIRWRTAVAIPLEAREQRVWRLPVHDSEFADVPHASAKARCENTQAPEALTTPNPVLDAEGTDSKIQVSFIVGTDGRVHSPLILQSGGTRDVRAVLDTVRFWRYRPAMCNGVPTETEGRIQFSSR